MSTPTAKAKPNASPRARMAGFVVALLVLVGAGAGLSSAISAYQLHIHKEPIYPADGRVLTSVPKESASWIQDGSDRRESAEIEEVLGTKNYISRIYRRKVEPNKEKPLVLELHAAYYTGMIDTVPHVPDRCFLGGGMDLGQIAGNLPIPFDHTRWQPDDDVPDHLKGKIFRVRAESGVYVRLPREPDTITLRTMKFLRPGGSSLISGYFFVANGSTVAEAEGVRLLAFDLSSKYAYYMKVQVTALSGVAEPEDLPPAAASLLNELMGDLMLCTPDWVDVEKGDYPPADAASH